MKKKNESSLAAMLIAFAILLLVGCVQTPKQKLIDSGVEQLNDMELKELHTDAVQTWTSPKGISGKNTYHSDGTVTVEWKGNKDEGTWIIKNNSMCSSMTQMRNGVERCFAIFKTGDNEYKVFGPDGTLAWSGSFSKL